MIKERILPASIQWHITSSCINRCKHCYTYGVGSKETPTEDLSEDQLYQILNNIKDFERKYNVVFPMFSITGGDPLFTANGWKIIEKLRSENRQVGILGIPERVNEASIKKMKKLGVMFYQVSLDGLKDTHDAIRGIGSFDRTIEAIKLLDLHNMEYRIMFTVHNLNQDELLPLIDYLESLNLIGYFAFDFMIGPVEQADELSPRMLNAEEAERIIKLYHEKSKSLLKKASRMLLLQKTGMNRVLSMKSQNQEERVILDNGCSVGKSFSILADGTVYPCRRLPISIGNLLTDALEDIYLNNSLMKEFRRRDHWEECNDCKYFNMCKGCPAVSYAFSGNPLTKMEYCFLKEKNEEGFDYAGLEEDNELSMILRNSYDNIAFESELGVMDLWKSVREKPVLKKDLIQRLLNRR